MSLAATPPLAGRYRALYADPPWRFATYSDKSKGRSAEVHYDGLSLPEVQALPAGQWAAPDAVLFLRTTDPMLDRSLEVLRAWGFVYKTMAFHGVKLNQPCDGKQLRPRDFFTGMGFWTRANPELCLLATRGRPRSRATDVPRLLLAPRREPSSAGSSPRGRRPLSAPRWARGFPTGAPPPAQRNKDAVAVRSALLDGVRGRGDRSGSGRRTRLDLLADSPQERRHLARDRRGDHGLALARGHEPAVAATQPQLRLPGDLTHGPWAGRSAAPARGGSSVPGSGTSMRPRSARAGRGGCRPCQLR